MEGVVEGGCEGVIEDLHFGALSLRSNNDDNDFEVVEKDEVLGELNGWDGMA